MFKATDRISSTLTIAVSAFTDWQTIRTSIARTFSANCKVSSFFIVATLFALSERGNPLEPCNGTDPCQNGAACYMNVGYEICVCSPGFTGEFCEIEIDECLPAPCGHGGTCIDLENNYTCNCSATTFIGHNCEIREFCLCTKKKFFFSFRRIEQNYPIRRLMTVS